MLYRLAALASCVAAIPFAPQPLTVRQTEPKYADNGTLTNPPNVTSLSRPNPKYTTSQLNQVKLAYTEIERLGLIRSFGNTDDYFKFDLTPDGSQSNAANGLGGQGYLAEVSNFPVLMGTGLSVAIGYLNPCGLDSMHIHNRATEIVTLVKGTSLKTGFVLEDGFGMFFDIQSPPVLDQTNKIADLPVYTEIGLYQGTIRPQGSIHWEFNDHCDSAVFVASLSNEDPGVSRTAQNFFINPQQIVDADLAYPSWLDNVNTTDFRSQLPAAFAQGAKEVSAAPKSYQLEVSC
jgi:hypothetical protein